MDFFNFLIIRVNCSSKVFIATPFVPVEKAAMTTFHQFCTVTFPSTFSHSSSRPLREWFLSKSLSSFQGTSSLTQTNQFSRVATLQKWVCCLWWRHSIWPEQLLCLPFSFFFGCIDIVDLRILLSICSCMGITGSPLSKFEMGIGHSLRMSCKVSFWLTSSPLVSPTDWCWDHCSLPYTQPCWIKSKRKNKQKNPSETSKWCPGHIAMDAGPPPPPNWHCWNWDLFQSIHYNADIKKYIIQLSSPHLCWPTSPNWICPPLLDSLFWAHATTVCCAMQMSIIWQSHMKSSLFSSVVPQWWKNLPGSVWGNLSSFKKLLKTQLL